jgi:hypothetical protein
VVVSTTAESDGRAHPPNTSGSGTGRGTGSGTRRSRVTLLSAFLHPCHLDRACEWRGPPLVVGRESHSVVLSLPLSHPLIFRNARGG